MLVRLLQLLNAVSPMFSTLSGTTTLLSFWHWAYMLSGNDLRPAEIVVDVAAVHLLKANGPTLVTVLGMSML